MIEIPPKFSGLPPVNPHATGSSDAWSRQWQGAQGLAEDILRYGGWIRDEAQKRIGQLYPKVEISAEQLKSRPDLEPYTGQKLTVVAWLWARTVKSPNPAFADVDVPLVSSFVLSPMEGREVYIEPVVEGRAYRFTVRVGNLNDPEAARAGTKLARGANFKCIMSGVPISGEYIKAEGKAGRMGTRLLAIVAEGSRERIYLAPTDEHETIAASEKPAWRPEGAIAARMTGGNCTPYGLTSWGDVFTDRQLVALSTFSDLVSEVRELVARDAVAAGLADDGRHLRDGGSGATAYGDAIGVYLGFLVSKLADKGSSLCTWDAGPASNKSASGRSARSATVRVTFGRQALPMTWDFAEVNFFSESVGGLETVLKTISLPLSNLLPSKTVGKSQQFDAQSQTISRDAVVSTDPPYYDNIGYADLSDFFYVWLRRSLRNILPELFGTLATPKAEELVATPYRHGGRDEAERFFLDGMTKAMHRLAEQAHPSFPVTIYYAFKQSETQGAEGTASTGWETFLDAVIRAGFGISGTWPMRTEMSSRMVGSGANALASSIILVCRKRPEDAEAISRRAFQRELNQTLPQALDEMTRGSGDDRSPVAPVDLSQSIIGPGMAVFSKYSAVLEADGTPMSVRTALQLINRFLAEDDYDHDTQFCLQWFEQFGWKDGRFGEADTLARAKGTSVEGVKQSGVLFAAGGVVRLLKWAEYPGGWDAENDDRLPVWEILHQLIRVFKTEGEAGAGKILAAVAAKAEPTRQLAYRLYTLCERAGWAEDARGYNEVIASWSAIEDAAAATPKPRQTTLFDR
jgi:putative DNA methylase